MQVYNITIYIMFIIQIRKRFMLSKIVNTLLILHLASFEIDRVTSENNLYKICNNTFISRLSLGLEKLEKCRIGVLVLPKYKVELICPIHER